MRGKSLRSDVTIQIEFAEPIFAWRDMQDRFFSAIYHSLQPQFSVTTRDFSIAQTPVLGEHFVRYNLFAGANAISLYADKLLFEYRNLIPSDYAAVTQITKLAHDGFSENFKEIELKAVEYQAYEHVEILDGTPAAFLGQFAAPELKARATRLPGEFRPGVRFRRVNVDQKTVVSLNAEDSMLSAKAVFFAMSVTISDATAIPTFEQKYELVGGQLQQSLALLDFEMLPPG